MIRPVLLAGGSGAGLWPYSRRLHPKVIADLVGDRPLLSAAFDLARRFGEPAIVAQEAQRFLVAERCQHAPHALFLEPEPRDTGAAIFAMAWVYDPTDILLVLPTDSYVQEPAAWGDHLDRAVQAARAGRLALVGVPARSPSSDYGYVVPGASDGVSPPPVDAYVEKPGRVEAEALIARGALWNAGVLAAPCGLLRELGRQHGELDAIPEVVARREADRDFIRWPADAWSRVGRVSFERQILPSAPGRCVVAADVPWADIGTWSALREAHAADLDGNVLRGDVVAVDTRGSFVHAHHRLVATLGIRDILVVETADAVLVADASAAGRVAEVVARLGQRPEVEHHTRVARPWGAYETLGKGTRHQIKRITVAPGASLSLQSHAQRAEHWVVVQGVARVTRGDEVFELRADESTYIPQGTRHRLENAGGAPLELIEVQSGDYLGEDDIVRYDDRYGRR